jgi:hypothetical protein
MHPIIPQPGQTAPPSHPAALPLSAAPAPAPAPANPAPVPRPPDRIARLTALTPEDATAGLLWLAMNYPAVTDAMLDKLEYDAIDDPDPGREPEPFCATCGAHIGIFLRFGLDWRHYRGDGTVTGQTELFDPGHHPVVAWRPTRIPAAR